MVNKPIESHKNAAWADIDETKCISNVAKPKIKQTIDAKEYVEENEK